MEITRQMVLAFTIVFGPLVLVSYAYGLSHFDRPDDLWGGIPTSWQTYIAPFMFVAAAGFLIYWWIALFQFDESALTSLHWPWADSDGMGAGRLLLAYALILIPSALWLESTIYHLEHDYAWTPVLVVGFLLLTSVGNMMLGLLAYGAHQDGLDHSGLMLAGAGMLAIQCIFNDLVIWVYKFPW
ncbi:MAG: hypothetical protein QGH57_00785 [Candidatus Thalassarchaeaceae archaeon]|nr:hypothetical protein [Actinomycetota bacterium]MDP6220741.1 hypothetical protein [Candidatus Thalassarchaeaceae archaeon]MDP7256553.1 hypothetical protein [Candidatus Thalassarchaeaceae archaeon]MDP7648682.1 hypothetical protein [Candidatus Thalassarchaeaceae archaeon]HJL55182.1 hypothetical protein [Candidatus Thalassarchaeaceae archaeon]